MAPTRVASFLFLFFLVSGTYTSSVHGAADDDTASFVYAGCSQGRYAAGTQYESGVDSVLTSLANSAPYAPYANTTSPASSAVSAVSGLYQCRSDLASSICTSCVRSAINRLSSLCAWSSGGAVQLRGCFVRYGNDSFVGKPNTAVLFKKCGGGSPDAGAGAMAMRDSALGALASEAAPGYRAGGAGGVQAMAQCVGDLDAKACSECVSAAAAQLKAGCGNAGAGEVYLGKCYARFWSNGGGFVSSGAGNRRLALAVAVAGGFFASSLAYLPAVLM
ncbi:cysteine-rich repeat secretory protein 12-like [Brachypodium distachyon]|uniref:Gnk2-homologous domain-containing protein n=1 Tax=Brachypodium distachyon TaxID=15368 RepID=I1IFJ1_BRADI|nr:cysteine-rich repeat secretory protein 12-like [Brachypodium distachyon]PNT69689.1 hypothetical protein BRADI_3g60011v3 [Brachypodium distachyon]|eukprot:XP_003573132.1 cysteine-rich repeat secretory protein 12-like [Brachypodium distachyon]